MKKFRNLTAMQTVFIQIKYFIWEIERKMDIKIVKRKLKIFENFKYTRTRSC